MKVENDFHISYGKMHIPLYRTYATPLLGITPIPESSFTGRANTLLALEVDVEVYGQNFLAAYTHGDNSQVVATDSMKNFVLRQALDFEGSSIEEFLTFLGQGFLTAYPQMESLRLAARELSFEPVPVPQPFDNEIEQGKAFGESPILLRRSYADYSWAEVYFQYHQSPSDTDEKSVAIITDHRSGRLNIELLKITGSSFTHFVQDEYTTLPERRDRPLFIHLDVYWKYVDSTVFINTDHTLYIPGEQVRDLIQTVFHQFVSESIQHLVHEMGQRLLARFSQLAEVTFEAQNRTRDLVAASPYDEQRKVYSDPFPAYGSIKLTIRR